MFLNTDGLVDDLASYATKGSIGRFHEKKSIDIDYRDPYQRDIDKIVHSGAFRKLEYKTQVFENSSGDYYRTRLTHSLEVARIARSIARRLSLNEDLCEALALVHDIGHSPFGHGGEKGLNSTKFGIIFDHNVHALRIVTALEEVYIDFNGLDLSWEVLEGMAKHNGPVPEPSDVLKDIDGKINLRLNLFPSLEAQVASIADDIAYNNHDIDDGYRAGLINLAMLSEIEFLRNIISEIVQSHGEIVKSQEYLYKYNNRLSRCIRSKSINMMINDIVVKTKDNIARNNIKDVEDVRNAGKLIACFSDEMASHCKEIKQFLFNNLYHSSKIKRMEKKAINVMSSMFEYFHDNYECIPESWRKNDDRSDQEELKIQDIVDYLAGMTDRYALKEYRIINGLE